MSTYFSPHNSGFEYIELSWPGVEVPLDTPDSVFDFAATRGACGTLLRHKTVAAEWTLCRLSVISQPSRVFVFPSPNVTQPPASLWLGNLRECALDSSWGAPSDLWCEVVCSGWAGYDFNKIQERTFTPTGGAIDGQSTSSWGQYCEESNLPPELLCALPWGGLAAMWGERFWPMIARRETIALNAAIPETSPSSPELPQGRPRRRLLKV